VRQPSYFFWLPSPAARPGAGGDGGALQGGTSSGPWGCAADAVHERRSVRCATTGEKTATRPSWMCRGPPAGLFFGASPRPWSTMDQGVRSRGENARRTQKGASDSDAGLHRDAASKAHAGFVER
jgi:hypothetical protein